MKVSENLVLYEQIKSTIWARVVKERKDWHLSDSIWCARKTYFRKKKLAPPPSMRQLMLWTMGYAFQDWLFPNNKEQEIEVDGVVCTPDVSLGIEVKSTRGSEAKFNIYEADSWLKQIKGYCKALGKREYDLVPLFLCGDYKPPFPSLPIPSHLEFTQQEIDDNWLEVLGRKGLVEACLEQSRVPPANYKYPWECKDCECKCLCTKEYNGTKEG